MKDERRWREETERLKDLQERYAREKSSATSKADYQHVADELVKMRRSYRLKGVRLGKRSRGVGVAIHTIMWPVWFDIAVDNELSARRAYQELIDEHHTENLLPEFRAALVVVAAAASAVEALLGDVRYLVPPIPERSRRETRKAVRAVWGAAFSPTVEELDALSRGVSWLYGVRNAAVHAATESVPAEPHPAGLNSGRENSIYNAVTARRAVDIASSAILMSADAQPASLDSERAHWVSRWSTDRSPYHRQVADAVQRRREVPEPTVVHPHWRQ